MLSEAHLLRKVPRGKDKEKRETLKKTKKDTVYAQRAQ